MKKLFVFIAIALLPFQFQPTAAIAQVAQTPQVQTSDKYTDRLRAFEDFVRQQMEKNKIPGLTVGFIKDDYIWVKGFGYADLENKTPAKADSACRLASVQKSMTAAAILQLVEQGKINLDAEIQTYVPYFPKKKYPITVRQILYHLGGIPHYVNRDLEQHIKEHKTTREAIAIFENFDLVAEPGTKFSYSSYGYNLLGAVIEGVTKQSYADYMREHIWQPLGMNDTRMDDPSDLIPNRVRGYQIVNGELKNSEFIDVSSRFAAGGTRGTVTDLLKFMKGLNDGKTLSPKSVDLMYAPMKTRDGNISGFPKTAGYAMGWNLTPQSDGLVVINDGGQQETRTFILNFPAKKFALAVAQNLERDDDGAIIFRLYELVLNEKFSLGGQAQEPGNPSVKEPALRLELLKRVEQDQAIRNELISKGVQNPDKAILMRMEAIETSNIKRMRAIVSQYGWPSPELVGRDGAEAAFLLVQHADLAFQKEMLPLVEKAYRGGGLSGQSYALLLDRVLVGEGKPQVFGTQAKRSEEWKGQEPALEPIEDEANVDKRRAEVGLPPLSEYRQLLKRMYFPKNGKP